MIERHEVNSITRATGRFIREYVSAAIAAITQRLDDFDKRLREAPAGPRGERGETGAIGAEGPRGPAGESIKGERGEIGPAGPKGEPGASVKGERGEIGLPGQAGQRGEIGLVGAPGPKGDTGSKGEDGERGERGESGPKGEAGAAGTPGPQGLTGERGLPGVPGEAGPRGEDGERGLQGEIGIPGESVKGDPGPIGSQGERGIPGESIKGERGDRGEKGERGDPGVVGRDGRDASEIEIVESVIENRKYPKGVLGVRADGLCRSTGDGWIPVFPPPSILVDIQIEKVERVTTHRHIFSDGKEIVRQTRSDELIYRGVHVAGKEYEKGDVVTRSGSMWVCEALKTKAEPGGKSTDWRLVVKQGADGKTPKDGEPGPQGPAGRDLRYK